MALQSWLLPNEQIRYSAPEQIMITGGQYYSFYITSDRIIFYTIKGFFSKSESIISEKLFDINTMLYEEQGILPKWGILRIETKYKKLDLAGKPETMKAIWMTLQHYVRRD